MTATAPGLPCRPTAPRARAAVCAVLAAAIGGFASGPALAVAIVIPAASSAGPARGAGGDGLIVRFKDVGTGCTLDLIRTATDTVTVQVTTMPRVDFLLNQGCSFGPFEHGCGYFETRWDSYLDIRVPGDYVFSMQVDAHASVAIGGTTILEVEGAHWFENVTTDTIRFVAPGSYPLRAYYADCQPCCRGFRLAAMGPPGSDLMPFTQGFDFNLDMGPCCTTGNNGPGLAVIPADLFFRSAPVVGVEREPRARAAAAIRRTWVTPNPSGGAVRLSVDLAREQRVWAEVFDASGRRVRTLANGARCAPGVASWSWTPGRAPRASAGSGAYFYRVRTADGGEANGRFTIVR